MTNSMYQFDLNDFISTTELGYEDFNNNSSQVQPFKSTELGYSDYANTEDLYFVSITPPYTAVSPNNDSYLNYEPLDITASFESVHNEPETFDNVEDILSLNTNEFQLHGILNQDYDKADIFSSNMNNWMECSHNFEATLNDNQGGLILSHNLPITPGDSPKSNHPTTTTTGYPTPSPTLSRELTPLFKMNNQNIKTTMSTSPKNRTSRSGKKLLNSRLSINSLSQVLNLPLQETVALEAYILQKFTEVLLFPLGKKTWIRDTTDTERKTLLSKLYDLCIDEYPHIVTLENLEIIIKRATYSCMQGRLRKERRISTGITKKVNSKGKIASRSSLSSS